MVYKFKDGSHITGDPQVVGETIDTLRKSHGGRLKPEQVVTAAKRAKHPLHGYFEWDDTTAAKEFRRSQAMLLIRAVVLCPEEGAESFEPVRAFVSVRGDDDSRGYVHVVTAMEDDAMRGEVLAQAKSELASWRKRYADIQEFATVVAAIDAVVAA